MSGPHNIQCLYSQQLSQHSLPLNNQHTSVTSAAAVATSTVSSYSNMIDSTEVIQGTIKWFSNKKGYGFITPNEDQKVNDDIFVHQSFINSTGFRTLQAGMEVEFKIDHDEDGKIMAKDVSGKGGAPLVVRKKMQIPIGDKPTSRSNNESSITLENSEVKIHESQVKTSSYDYWYSNLIDDVSSSLSEKGIITVAGTIDISFGDYRIKLGSQGYSSCAHRSGKLVEGEFTSTDSGNITFTWEKCIEFFDGSWKSIGTAEIVSELNLEDPDIKAVGVGENAETLWGTGPSDPTEALKENGFKMRRVVLTSKSRVNRTRGKNRPPHGKQINSRST